MTNGKIGYLSVPATSQKVSLFVWVTALYIVVWFLQLGTRISLLQAIRFEFLLGFFLTMAAVPRLLASNERPSPLRGAILFWFAVCIFYVLFSYDRPKSWDVFYNRILKFSMMALFISVFVSNEKELKVVVFAFLFAMLKLGQEGFVGWLGGGLVWQNQGIMRLHGSTPLYRHPNSFSGMAVGCLPFIFALFPVVNKYIKSLLALLLVFCAVIIVFTGSRTGYVATLLLLSLYFRKKLTQNFFKYLLLGIAFIVVAINFAPEQYIGRFMSIFTMEEAEGHSSATRVQILLDAIGVFLDKPWGVGVAAFPTVRMEMYGRFQDTHNLYLELLTNLSVIGMVAFAYLVLKILKLCRQNIVAGDQAKNHKFAVAVSHAVIGYILARLFLGLFGMDTYEIYWWFAAGLAIASWKVLRIETLDSYRNS